jgi:hypothetical protein
VTLRTGVFRHRGPRHRAACGAAAVMTSHPTVRFQRAASELHSSRPWGVAIPSKALIFRQLVFQRWIAERPFRLAKFTACRKKCAFLSVPRHEVKAPQAETGKNHCNSLPLKLTP